MPEFTDKNLRIYYGAVRGQADGELSLQGSRAIAVVGIGNSLIEAEQLAERAASLITGPVFHRRDIGTAALVQSRVDHMKRVRSIKASIALEKTNHDHAHAKVM